MKQLLVILMILFTALSCCCLAINMATVKGLPNTNQQNQQDAERNLKSNCYSCHRLDKDMVGPALKTAVQNRDQNWLFQFLTNRKSLKMDARSDSLKKAFAGSCVHFPELKKQAVYAMYAYLKKSGPIQ